jgi:hypothetical protein
MDDRSPEMTHRIVGDLASGARLIGIVSSICFIVSLLISLIIFQKWGLDFFEVASTSDVINTGLGALLPAIAFVLGALSGLWLFSYIPERFRIIFTLSIGFIGLGIASYFFFAKTSESLLNAPAIFSFGLAAQMFSRGVAADQKAAPWPLKQNDPRWKYSTTSKSAKLIVAVVTIVYSVFFVYSLISERAIDVMEDGYSSYFQTVELTEHPKDCALQLLWQGERALVARCRGSRPEEIMVIRPDETIIIRVGQVLKHRPARFMCSLRFTTDC